MSRRSSHEEILETWTNGARAIVFLVKTPTDELIIRKDFRPGQRKAMLREFCCLLLLHKLAFVPKIVRTRLIKGVLDLEYVQGTRLLEWVLERYGPPNLQLASFQSMHGLDDNATVRDAFDKFKRSTDPEAVKLRSVIQSTYQKLHSLFFRHGDPSPRNLIYDGHRVFLIDFDHGRPCLRRPRSELDVLQHWYGVTSTE